MYNLDDIPTIRTLKESVVEPRLHRVPPAVAMEDMPNFQALGETGGVPFEFTASWTLHSRPRRIALLMDDCQEEYRDYAKDILSNLELLTKAFRTARDRNVTNGSVQLVWSVWSRFHDDGISNAMDRWYGPRGLNPHQPTNALYVWDGTAGIRPLQEIAPTPMELQDGWCYYSRHLDMFWNFTPDGKSYLDTKLQHHGIDTVVICGLWTDECIMATAYAASARGYDVVVVRDAVATATSHHENALTILNGTVANVLSTHEVVEYLSKSFEPGPIGAVKGVNFPDGRKE